MTEKNLDQLFKDALSNHEADVNPNLWTNIQNGLNAPFSGSTFSGGSSAAKTAGILGKMSIKSLLFISAAAVTVVGTTIYFATKKPEIKTEVASSVSFPKNSVPEPVSNPLTPSSSTNNNAISNDVKAATSEKPIPAEAKKSEPVVAVQSKTENTNSSATNKTVPANTPYSAPSSAPAATAPATKNDNPASQIKSADTKSEKTSDAKAEPSESQNKTDEQPAVASDNSKATEPAFDQIEKYLLPAAGNKKELPNSFTPNGDGYDDDFTIKTTGLKTLEVIIFDRNTKMVYSWKSLDGKWDGKMKDGSEAPEGDYFYSLNAETLDGKICIAQSTLKLFR